MLSTEKRRCFGQKRKIKMLRNEILVPLKIFIGQIINFSYIIEKLIPLKYFFPIFFN